MVRLAARYRHLSPEEWLLEGLLALGVLVLVAAGLAYLVIGDGGGSRTVEVQPAQATRAPATNAKQTSTSKSSETSTPQATATTAPPGFLFLPPLAGTLPLTGPNGSKVRTLFGLPLIAPLLPPGASLPAPPPPPSPTTTTRGRTTTTTRRSTTTTTRPRTTTTTRPRTTTTTEPRTTTTTEPPTTTTTEPPTTTTTEPDTTTTTEPDTTTTTEITLPPIVDPPFPLPLP
jgi:hypothetical protein